MWKHNLLFNSFWINVTWPIKKFFKRINNLKRWFLLIWKDQDWDYGFSLDMEQKKLANMIKWYEDNNYGISVNGKQDCWHMKLAYNCLQIIRNSDWWEIDTIPFSEWSKLDKETRNTTYHINAYVNKRNARRFFPNISNEYLNSNSFLIYLREEKAWRLYHKIREQYMRSWWD